MNTLTLSSKGQVVIPKSVRQSANLSFGDVLSVHYIGGEIRLRPLSPQAGAQLDQVAGCLAKPGSKKLTDAQLASAIRERLKARNSA